MYLNMTVEEFKAILQDLQLVPHSAARRLKEAMAGHAETPELEAYREAARAQTAGKDDISLDDDIAVSPNDEGGAHVQVWLWISEADIEVVSDEPNETE